MRGELVCIDLSGNDSSLNSSSAPFAPIRYRLDLKNDYPMGMRHVKIGDKHYLVGGIKDNAADYSDEVFELDTESCRLITDIIHDPKLVLERATTRLKEAKFAMVFNLKGKHYLLNDMQSLWVFGRQRHDASVPFERLDTAPPFCSHKAPIPTRDDNVWFYDPSYASNHFIIDDKLVLLSTAAGSIQIFTPPDDDDDGDGKWSSPPDLDYHAVVKSFQSLTGSVPPTGIFLSGFHVNDGSTPHSLGVVLSLQRIFNSDKINEEMERQRAPSLEDLDASRIITDEVCAYIISTETYKPKYCQKLDGVFSDFLYDLRLKYRMSLYSSSYRHLLDLGKGHLEGARRICAILFVHGFDNDIQFLTPYIFISFFDVQLIEPPPDVQSIEPAGERKFLQVLHPIKKLAFKLDKQEKWESISVLDAFLV